ncbi:MAG: hypothetical protein R8M14_00170 [Ghiorsea sp.]
MLRTTVLSILACLALSANAFAADTSVNLEKSILVAAHHEDSKSSEDSKSEDSSSKDSSSEDDKSHDSKS